jgi:hypothetical protein
MRKQAAFLVIMLTFGLVFAGAVSAQDEEPTIDVVVVDENGPVDVACPGDEVAVVVNASANDDTVELPAAFINVDPETGLTFEVDDVVMMFLGEIYENDDPDKGDFFYWSDYYETWLWDISDITKNYLYPNEEAMLLIPAIVDDCGPITVTADFMAWPRVDPEPSVIAEDSYTFMSGPCHNCHGKVPMQNTGTPVALAALGLLGIIGGTVYGRLR